MAHEWISRADAAEFLGVSANTMDRMIAERRIPVYRLSSRLVKIDRADLEGFLESCRVDPPVRTRKRKPAPEPCPYVPGMKVV